MKILNFKIFFKPSLWLTIFTIPSFIILLILGSWQVQRLGWKSDLISEYNNNFEKQPVTIDEVLKDSLNYKFRKVLVKGEFDNDKEIQLIGKTYEGNAGYHIITPFFLENNKVDSIVHATLSLHKLYYHFQIFFRFRLQIFRK